MTNETLVERLKWDMRYTNGHVPVTMADAVKEIERLTAELAACREAAIEECAKIAEKHGADDGGPSDTGSARVANVVREIRALKGQK